MTEINKALFVTHKVTLRTRLDLDCGSLPVRSMKLVAEAVALAEAAGQTVTVGQATCCGGGKTNNDRAKQLQGEQGCMGTVLT